MYLSSKLRAFTLLECLVALLVIAGSVQVYQGLTTVLVSNVKQVRQQENQDWLLFVQQMEAELEGCQLVKVEGNKLYVKKDNQDLAFGLSSASDFRKTNADGRGYQPMLFDVKSSKVSQKNQIVTIQVTLKNELQRSFVYAFWKKQVMGRRSSLRSFLWLAVFTLLLQVYLERVVASSRQNQAQIVASQSRLMAEMTMDLVDKEAGAFSFSQGTTTYEVKGKQVVVRVASKGQIKTYRYVKKQDQK